MSLALALGMLLLGVVGVAATCSAQEARVLYGVQSESGEHSRQGGRLVDEARLLYGVEIVEKGQTWDEVSLKAVLDALESLPPSVVRSLGNSDYGLLHILANPEASTLSGARPYSSGANFYFNDDGRNEIVLMPGQGTLTVLHEMGHAYQMRSVPAGRYAWVYLEPEMRDFMAATGWRLLTSDQEVAGSWDGVDLLFRYDGPPVWGFLSRQDPAEDFATSFAFYFYDPATLAERSPARFEWFHGHLGDGAE